MILAEEITKRQELQERFFKIQERLKIPEKHARLAEVNTLQEDPNLWNDQEQAKKISQEQVRLTKFLADNQKIVQSFIDLESIEELVATTDDPSLESEYASKMSALSKEVDAVEVQVFCRGRTTIMMQF